MSFELRGLDPELQPAAEYLIGAIREAGYPVRVTSVLRSSERQAALYAEYRAGRHPYPVAPPGRSQHEYGLAWDMVVEPYEILSYVGPVWQSWGGAWGGQGDPIHFGVRI